MTETSLTAEDYAWVVIDGHRTQADEIDDSDVLTEDSRYRLHPLRIARDWIGLVGGCNRTIVMAQRPTDAEARRLADLLVDPFGVIDQIESDLPEIAAGEDWDVSQDVPPLMEKEYTRARERLELVVQGVLATVLWPSIQAACARLDWDNAWHVTVRDGQVVECVKVGEGGSDG